MPWDDDTRASYLIEDGRVEVIRVDYDIEAEARESKVALPPTASGSSKCVASRDSLRPTRSRNRDRRRPVGDARGAASK
jgi:hypothetical protein